MDACRCGSGKLVVDCCGPCLDGTVPAATAEALMRSRYVAYTLSAEPYLLATWHTTTRPKSLNFDTEPPLNWIGLVIKGHELQGDDHATVEFVARYKVGGRAYRLHETSRFVLEDGCWFYIDGDIEN
jgi:SEC-C motif-containing protein